MDLLLPRLVGFPSPSDQEANLSDRVYDTQIRSLLQILNTTPTRLLLETLEDESGLLDVLDPAINTIPYLYTLLAHVAALQEEYNQLHGNQAPRPCPIDVHSALWEDAVNFVERFDARQIRYAGPEWRSLLELMAKSARSDGKAIIAIHPIRTAILRLDPECTTFTSNHLLFAELCLETRSFRDALPIIEHDILEFPTSGSQAQRLPSNLRQPSSGYITASSGHSAILTAQDHLKYHLFTAMLYMGLKRWDRALEFLEYVIETTTTSQLSNIMVDGYKKWILVHLIYNGKVPALPKTVSYSTSKLLSTLAKPYEAMASAFSSGSYSRFFAEASVGQQIWNADKNAGLVKQAATHHQRFAVLNLSKTFSTVPLSYLESRGLPSDEKTLLSMLPSANNNSIVAPRTLPTFTISRPQHSLSPSSSSSSSSPRSTLSSEVEPILTFSSPSMPTSPPDAAWEKASLEEMERRVRSTAEVAKRIRAFDNTISLNTHYVNMVATNRKAKELQAADGANSTGRNNQNASDDMDFDMEDIDEDMMADF
ncbi:MAG: hypothetical protein M1825_003860 [Sarcosagium campestre]|nr:MAG: hypothetical protein M1825_003860 [Sarcosagium campestre]